MHDVGDKNRFVTIDYWRPWAFTRDEKFLGDFIDVGEDIN